MSIAFAAVLHAQTDPYRDPRAGQDPSSAVPPTQTSPVYPRTLPSNQTYGAPDQNGMDTGAQTIPDTDLNGAPTTGRQGQYPYQNDSPNQTDYPNQPQYPNQNRTPIQQQNQGGRTNPQNQNPNSRMLSMPERLPLTEFQKVVSESTGKLLPIFGADIFRATPSTFAPVDNIPVTPDYVIGPGDELRLQIWGQVNHRGSYVVDRTGAIALPGVGSTHVAGLHYTQLSEFLKSQLGRVYRNFDLNVNLGQLRSIQVFVVGKAKQPGSYTVGSLSTLLNALFASGGPQPLGSLRDIQLRRNGETISHFDLYDLLLRGDKSKDVPLASGDVIFIPDVGPQVAVLGSVKSAAIYELRGETAFQQVVALAGGETNVAAGTTARVERVLNHAERSVISVNLQPNEPSKVQDGDVVIVNSIVDRFKDAVTLRGNVANPGRYAWHPGMHVSDLIPTREALVTRDYYRRRNQLGQLIADVAINAPREIPGTVAVESAPTSGRTIDRTAGSSSGGGTSAGAALTASNRGFTPRNDVVLNAPDIDWDYAVIERQSAENLTSSLLPFNLGKLVLDKDSTQDLELLSGDVVTIFSKADIRVPSSRQTKFVKLEGEFSAAGTYSVQPGETLRHLLQRAGGFSPDAYLFASEFTRESVRRLEQQRIQEYADSLESQITAQTSALISSALTDRDAAAAQASESQGRASLARLRQLQPTGRVVLQLKPDSLGLAAVPDLELEDGDRFVVPKIPATVNVVGQVYSANAFVFEPNRRVRDYLRLAGGPDRLSDIRRAFILRADGSVLSHQYASTRHFGDFDHIVILPGDTVVVPPKLVKGTALRELTNVATILQGFGIAAAAVQVLR
ncbi:MAG: SLBB domain-containing protein [Acidobacteriaceae bacterium]